jgi:hypothetical protein
VKTLKTYETDLARENFGTLIYSCLQWSSSLKIPTQTQVSKVAALATFQ